MGIQQALEENTLSGQELGHLGLYKPYPKITPDSFFLQNRTHPTQIIDDLALFKYVPQPVIVPAYAFISLADWCYRTMYVPEVPIPVQKISIFGSCFKI